ncbi:hypothetical protein KEM48_012311, partial [Puccinia striiformis f. sp. tritici PST-130]
NQSTVPHGQAGDYYGHQSPTSPVYNQNQYLPPSGPPPPSTNQAPTYGHQFQPGVEDPLAMLSRYDTVILVDDSGSMEMFWDETRDALIGVVEKAIQYDSDGIDLFFFNDPSNAINCNSPDQVRRVFRNVLPRRSTPTAASIKRVLDPYLTLLHQSKNGGPTIKPMNLIVLTGMFYHSLRPKNPLLLNSVSFFLDGEPDRGQDPEQVIVEIGRYLDSNRFPLNQLGISFVQIGNDSDATRHLIALDDGLKAKHKIRDFVDCTPYQNVITADFILKALIGGVNRKIDHLRL